MRIFVPPGQKDSQLSTDREIEGLFHLLEVHLVLLASKVVLVCFLSFSSAPIISHKLGSIFDLNFKKRL